ncbi:MAG: hypothetical protein U9R32_01760, partial [Bacteroidota bacterium]|nr:hypothetical protein [Bacteroidota bacterium]
LSTHTLYANDLNIHRKPKTDYIKQSNSIYFTKNHIILSRYYTKTKELLYICTRFMSVDNSL